MKYFLIIFQYNNNYIYIPLQVIYYFNMAMIDFSDSEQLKKITTFLYLESIKDIAREMGYKGKRPDNMLRTDLAKEGIRLRSSGWEIEYHGKKKKRVYHKRPIGE
jgi:hypothetical protein